MDQVIDGKHVKTRQNQRDEQLLRVCPVPMNRAVPAATSATAGKDAGFRLLRSVQGRLPGLPRHHRNLQEACCRRRTPGSGYRSALHCPQCRQELPPELWHLSTSSAAAATRSNTGDPRLQHGFPEQEHRRFTWTPTATISPARPATTPPVITSPATPWSSRPKGKNHIGLHRLPRRRCSCRVDPEPAHRHGGLPDLPYPDLCQGSRHQGPPGTGRPRVRTSRLKRTSTANRIT